MPNDTCSVEECGSTVHARGWCKSHYYRWYRTGYATTEGLTRNPPGVRIACSVEGCERDAECRKMCDGHYKRWRMTGETGGPEFKTARHTELCEVEGCDRLRETRLWCNTHYENWRRNGDPVPRGPKSGEESPNWRGSDVAYRTAHARVTKAKGRAADHECISCGDRAEDWAYDHGDPDARVSDGGLLYSAEPSHYQPMCRACHKSFDARHAEVRQVAPQFADIG